MTWNSMLVFELEDRQKVKVSAMLPRAEGEENAPVFRSGSFQQDGDGSYIWSASTEARGSRLSPRPTMLSTLLALTMCLREDGGGRHFLTSPSRSQRVTSPTEAEKQPPTVLKSTSKGKLANPKGTTAASSKLRSSKKEKPPPPPLDLSLALKDRQFYIDLVRGSTKVSVMISDRLLSKGLG